MVVHDEVGESIRQKPPCEFSLIFNGLKQDSRHYLGIFAVYSVDGKESPMIAFRGFKDESSYGAISHWGTFNEILAEYNRPLNEVLLIIGDNCSTNRKFARDSRIPAKAAQAIGSKSRWTLIWPLLTRNLIRYAS
ncbi:hypothetical protein K470DRAFT_260659 [Piedraia hortae CBS 480.64]|uniref:Uncharacterized protein n=1 Tax=Piedraia hortae CBS 480.64 TaxID=1314780 RepID=A0A6A7BS96_9PEZI|nr:hypothetical protein K470DRAFT_260659 [Piedraia hortae CBS 480.64]